MHAVSCRALEDELPGCSWPLVLSGWTRFLSELVIPLNCAPCQVGSLLVDSMLAVAKCCW